MIENFWPKSNMVAVAKFLPSNVINRQSHNRTLNFVIFFSERTQLRNSTILIIKVFETSQ